MHSLIQRQMIIWTFGLVLLFGVGVGFTLLQPPSTISLDKKAKSVERVPASIPPVSAVPQQIVMDPGEQVSDFKVTCETDVESSFSSTIQQVRLRGETCLPSKKAKLQSAQVRNLTNGFVATVFTPDDSKFSTDYINLKAGENKIEIEMNFSDGSRLARKLRFSRAFTN